MLSDLIDLTNSKEFFDNLSISTKALRMTRFTFEMDFYIFNDLTEQVLFECSLQARGLGYSAESRMIETGVGYKQINLYENHPILWNYQTSQYFILHGPVDDLPSLLGELYLVHQQVSGNWINFHSLVFGMSKRLNTAQETGIELPEPLIKSYLTIFQKHNLSYTPKNLRKNDGQYKTLIVGNEAITTNELNLGQPYIIAQQFSATVTAL